MEAKQGKRLILDAIKKIDDILYEIIKLMEEDELNKVKTENSHRVDVQP